MSLVDSLLWQAAVALPLALAAALALSSRRERLASLTPWAALPALLAALAPAAEAQLHLSGVLLDAHLGLDDVGRGFLFFTALLWMLSAWFAQGYLAGDRGAVRFHLFWLLAMSGNFALVLAQDMLSFYSGFALMSFAAYGLIIHSGQAAALRAGRIYIGLVVVGELLLFAGLLLLAHGAGGVQLESPRLEPVDSLAVLLVLAGFGIKAGALPLHVWLPLAHPAAPAPASAVLSGAMIKAGLLGWLRFLPAGAPGVAELSGLVIAAGLAAAFFGAAAGVTQSNPKTVLAYSSISQMGLMTVGLGIALLGPEAAPGAAAAVTLYALHHALAKGALFLGVGMSAHASAPAHRLWLKVGLLLPALALAGAPWTSGAVAKTALKANLSVLPGPWPLWLGWLLPLAAVGTALLMARFLALLWTAEAAHTLSPRRRTMGLSWTALLAAVAAAAWIWPGSGAAQGETPVLSKVWALSWPVLAGAFIAWLARLAPGRGFSRPWLHVPAGDLLAAAEWALKGLQGRWPTEALRGLGRRGAAAAAALRGAAAEGLAGRRFGAAEARLRSWPAVGLLLVLLMAALLLALAA
jgi:formate hydrogenlyase subunit 3/multisubunit Na+/H+ antiporter MnhD subunit